MANVKPDNLILRCYGYQRKDNCCFGLCLDFNLAIEAESPEQLKQKMKEVVLSYIETVLDTNDEESIPQLLSRRAPMHDWLIYYLIKALVSVRQFPRKFVFKEFIPFHLAQTS